MKVVEDASSPVSAGVTFPLDALGGLVTGTKGVLLVFWKAQ